MMGLHRLLACLAILAAFSQPARAASDGHEAVAALLILLNESDPAKSTTLAANTFTDNGVFTDQAVRAVGPKAINARIETVHRSLVGQKFQLIGPPLRQHDIWRLSYEVVDKSGLTAFEGLIFAVLAADGRFERVDMFAGPTAAPLP